MPRLSSLLTPALSVGFVVMWSSGFIGGRLGTPAASTVTLMVWRFTIVAVLLAGLAWIARRARPRRRLAGREVGVQALVGVLGQAVYIWATVAAIEAGVGAGTVAMIAGLQPLAATALAGPVLGERVRPRQWEGLLLGLVGVALVVGWDVTTTATAPGLAYAMPLVGVAALIAATLIERRAAPGTDLLDALTIQTAASAALFVVAAAATGALAPPAGQLPTFAVAVVWFIVLSTVGAYGFYWVVLHRKGVAHVSSLIYLTPPTTMVWAWLMFSDPIAPRALLGLAVCAAAVVIARPSRRAAAAPDPAGR